MHLKISRIADRHYFRYDEFRGNDNEQTVGPTVDAERERSWSRPFAPPRNQRNKRETTEKRHFITLKLRYAIKQTES